jgi:hypothetical protein
MLDRDLGSLLGRRDAGVSGLEGFGAPRTDDGLLQLMIQAMAIHSADRGAYGSRFAADEQHASQAMLAPTWQQQA